MASTNISSAEQNVASTAHSTESFPKTRNLFPSDERCYLSLDEQEWHLEDEMGNDWTFVMNPQDREHGIWTLTSQVEEAARNAASFAAGAWTAEAVARMEAARAERNEKRRQDEELEREEAAQRQRREEDERNQTRAIFVTNLPLDTDSAEIYNVFCRAGLIDESWDTDAPRIKMYFHENGEFKGEALIVYFEPAYARRAIRLFHKTDFRKGMDDDGDMTVELADSAYKEHDTNAERAADEQAAQQATQQGRPPRRRLTESDKAKIKAKKEEMTKRKDWGIDEVEEHTDRDTSNKWERMLVVKGMFTPEKLASDPSLLEDIREDLMDMCEKFGQVTAIVIWEGEPAGVVTVRFTTVEAAVACQKAINGKGYDGVDIFVRHSDGLEKFKRR
ncbi:hypothetical protein AMS68_007991 [Peltaster fructicola]|uniref:RRM domain-containing protein n=1 Tax=Peltaster fructicola TaxID=286661 RepID=A0A6H0Y620_9PEZI|nr:hypothetical protein AMS68_007991 [Peltaster fructicola]